MRKAAIILFIAIVFGPLAILAAESVGLLVSAGGGLAARDAIPTARHAALLARTLALAAGVAAGAVAVGTLAATALARWRDGAGLWARWLILLVVTLPPYVHVLAWSAAGAALGRALHAAGIPFGFEGWPAAWWVEVMAYTPLAFGLALVGLASVDPTLVEAARVARPDMHAFARVALPLAAPQILAAGGLIFVLSLTDYGVPSLFGLNVYTLELYAVYSGGGSSATVLLLALPLVAIAVAAVAGLQAGLRQAATRPLWGARDGGPLVWPRWFAAIQAVAVALALATALVPLLSLGATVGSWTNLRGAVVAAQSELAATAIVSLAAGAACLPLALAVGRKLAEGGPAGRAWWLLATLPLAVPAPLVGIGLITLWDRPVLGAAYGTLAMPWLAALTRFTPLAAMVLAAQWRRVDPLLLDAARVFQKSRLRALVQVRLPMLAPGLVAAACLMAALAAGELGATLLVAPPGQATLAMRAYNFLHYGASESVAGLCLMLTLGTLAAGLLAAAALRAWSRLFPNARGASS